MQHPQPEEDGYDLAFHLKQMNIQLSNLDNETNRRLLEIETNANLAVIPQLANRIATLEYQMKRLLVELSKATG